MARFSDIAEVDFLGDVTLVGLKSDAINYYAEELKKIVGNNTITVSDERKAELYAAAQLFYQLMQVANDKARQNLLKYARGKYLDNLVLNRSLKRKMAEKAVCTIRFTLSAPRTYAVAIPAGTRITTLTRTIYFAVDKTTEIPAGNLYIDTICTATEGGSAANNLTAGELNTLVDPIAYVATVSNVDVTQGGADIETDDALAKRFFDARNEYSTAGSENAYIYYTKSYSSTIADVIVKNNEAAVMDIYVLLESREAATEGFLSDLKDYLSNPDIKPLTDTIILHNVSTVDYNIDVSYTVYTENISKLAEIQTAIITAVENYKSWQCEKIGRDINIQKLISLMIAAGAAEVNIKNPTSTTVGETEIARCISTMVTYDKAITA